MQPNVLLDIARKYERVRGKKKYDYALLKNQQTIMKCIGIYLLTGLYNTNFFRFKVNENQLPRCKISMITTVVANKRIYQRDIP